MPFTARSLGLGLTLIFALVSFETFAKDNTNTGTSTKKTGEQRVPTKKSGIKQCCLDNTCTSQCAGRSTTTERR